MEVDIFPLFTKGIYRNLGMACMGAERQHSGRLICGYIPANGDLWFLICTNKM